MQHKMLRDLKPTHVAVAFDVGEETFRTRMDERYKAHRPPMPDELRVQIPLTQEALGLLGVAVLTEPDVEADDVIGTFAQRAAAAGFEVVIASTDKDLMQLVRDPSIKMWHTRLERLLDEKGVEEVFGVPPDRVGEVLTLMGDSSDNIPGCPGIGEKGAKELIGTWGSVEAIYAHLDEVVPPRARKALQENRDEVELSRELVRIRTDLKLGEKLDSLARRPARTEELVEFYRRVGFTSLLAELELKATAAEAVAAREATLEELDPMLRRDGTAVALSESRLAVATVKEVVVVAADPTATRARRRAAPREALVPRRQGAARGVARRRPEADRRAPRHDARRVPAGPGRERGAWRVEPAHGRLAAGGRSPGGACPRGRRAGAAPGQTPQEGGARGGVHDPRATAGACTRGDGEARDPPRHGRAGGARPAPGGLAGRA